MAAHIRARRRVKGRTRKRRYDPELAAYHRVCRKDTERFTKLKIGAPVKNVISQKTGRFGGLIARNHPFIRVSYVEKGGRTRETVWDVRNVSTKAVS